MRTNLHHVAAISFIKLSHLDYINVKLYHDCRVYCYVYHCIVSCSELHENPKVLKKCLSRGLSISGDDKLELIDDCNYVLTLDYTLKMLNIHERFECGVPVIIEGESGVGKTRLVQMLSELWNHYWRKEWKRSTSEKIKNGLLKSLQCKMLNMCRCNTVNVE